MFVKILNTSTLPYLQSSKAVKRKDFIGLSSSPNAFSDNLAGISLVAQYLQGYRFWTNSHSKITDQAILRRVFNKAIELDEKLVDSGLLEEASDTYPSLKSTMQAFIDLNYVKNVDGVKFIKNDTASLKYYMYQYSGIILECNLTSTTYNAHDVDISSAGDLQNEYFTKGFIAYGFDDKYVYAQNSLGIHNGSIGFHRIPWSIIPQIVIHGACYGLSNP